MTLLQFIDGLIGHLLSWPVAVVVLVVIFRRPIRRLLGRLTHAQVGGQQLDFGEGLDSAEDHAEGAAAPSEDEIRQATEAGEDESRRQQATGRIIDEWGRLEDAVQSLASARGVGDNRASATRLSRRLAEAGFVNLNYVKAVEELAALRNAVVHHQHAPTTDEAERYRQAVREIVEVSRLLVQAQTPTD